MTPALREATGLSEYDELPETVRCGYTLREWQWLSDAEKATLVRRETEPEWVE